MSRWVILPYDGSPVARATLRRAARLLRTGTGHHAGVIVATAGVDPAALDVVMMEAQAIAGADVPLELHLLSAGDPIGALHRLINAVPSASLAAPLGATGRAPWYIEACRLGVCGRTVMLFFLTPEEFRVAGDSYVSPRRGHELVGAIRRARSWLCRVWVRP
jgi:hypothetical protein